MSIYPPRPESVCAHCGLLLSPTAIICPRCQSVVVQAEMWQTPLVDKQGNTPEGKRKQAMLWWGVLAANLSAVALIGLGLLLMAKSGTVGPILASSNFTLVPGVMGLVGAYFWRDLRLTTTEYFLYSLVICSFGLLCGGLMMGEGIICLLIVSPLLIGFVFLGALLGRWLFAYNSNRLNVSLIPIALTLLICDIYSPHQYENSVSDTVLIHASPSHVWAHLAVVPPIVEKPDFWLFRMGLPYPVQSTATGQGVGAARRCIFSKNAIFEEKFTQWQPGNRLTFDVTSQPRDPEILGHARVLRGQFDLHDNGDGTTTLTGTSWYELYVYPSAYYDLWASAIARQVHRRVMDHIKTLSEQEH